MHRKRVVGAFLVVVCFFLPWVTPRCTSDPLSGWQLSQLPEYQMKSMLRGLAVPAQWFLAFLVSGILLLALAAIPKYWASQFAGFVAGCALLGLGLLYLIWNVAGTGDGSDLDWERSIMNIISDLFYLPLGPFHLRDNPEVARVARDLGLIDWVGRDQSEFGFWGSLLGFYLASLNRGGGETA